LGTKICAYQSINQCTQRNAALHNPLWFNQLGTPIFASSASEESGRWVLERRNKMNIAKSYNNWRSYRSAVAELSMLSDRDLSDLGIARADIRAVARQAAK
jgi:uncharacterized protein YjiS (DUF1127 family)